jgi:hypothetical protein
VGVVYTLTEYAERMWRGEARMRGLFADGAPMGAAAPVGDGLAVVPGFANVIAFQTADRLVLVDTGLPQTAQACSTPSAPGPLNRSGMRCSPTVTSTT